MRRQWYRTPRACHSACSIKSRCSGTARVAARTTSVRPASISPSCVSNSSSGIAPDSLMRMNPWVVRIRPGLRLTSWARTRSRADHGEPVAHGNVGSYRGRREAQRAAPGFVHRRGRRGAVGVGRLLKPAHPARATCCADRVKRVVFAAQSPLRAGVPTDLEHLLAAIGEVASQPGAVMAGTLDRPNANTARLTLREAKRLRVTAPGSANHRLRQHRSSWSDNDSERVLIAVRVDTDHVIHLVCKHPDRSSDSIRRV